MNGTTKKRHDPHAMLGVLFLSLLLILLTGNTQMAVADSFKVTSTMTSPSASELVLVQVGNPFTGTLTPTHFAYHFRLEFPADGDYVLLMDRPFMATVDYTLSTPDKSISESGSGGSASGSNMAGKGAAG